MASVMESYAALEVRIQAWAQLRPDILLALVVGSRARQDHPADVWADLDIVIFTTRPQAYVSPDWLAAFGEVWTAYRGQIDSGVPEWLVVLAGGLDLDVAVLPAEYPLSPDLVLDRLDDVLERGYRVLVDRSDTMSTLLPPVPRRAVLPDAFTYHNTVCGFWRYVARAAKKLRRGELWMAQAICDRTLTDFLLMMAGWHAQATDLAAETWYEGHFFEQWADPRLQTELRALSTTYDPDALWRALFAMFDIFRWLAMETAACLGYTYPAEADRHISAWARLLEQQRESE